MVVLLSHVKILPAEFYLFILQTCQRMNPVSFQEMSFKNSYKLAYPAQGHLLWVEASTFVL